MPGGLYEKIEGLQREVPSLKRIVIVPLDGTISFDGELLKPDPAWRDDYGKSTDASQAERVAVMLPTGGTTGHPKVARLTQSCDGRLLRLVTHGAGLSQRGPRHDLAAAVPCRRPVCRRRRLHVGWAARLSFPVLPGRATRR